MMLDRRRRIAIVAAFVAGLTAGAVGAPNVRAGPGGWNREAAAMYLDERMDVWFATATKLRAGQSETTCVSCHTVVPYALARPGLRRAMHVGAPTPQEVRLLGDVIRRVDTYDAHQPYYDFDEAKKVESRGTEAVLNALILASSDTEPERSEARDSVRRAFRRLWQTQRPDGAWDWLDFGLEPFESADAVYFGATLAALAVGSASGSFTSQEPLAASGIDRLRRYLTERYRAQNLFNRAWLLLASTRWKDLIAPAQREALVAEIRKAQRDDGGWSLWTMGGWRWSTAARPARPPGTPDTSLLARSDGYATGMAIYTLRCAGLPAADPGVRAGVQWLKANQQGIRVGERTHPAWRSYSLNHDREHGGAKGEPWRRLFMSDAATAFAVLALLTSD
ncbi:MAG: hypothetical protein DMD87_19790 [Candidatus Rokuibacteriota bacterium]|nr:MAG: hypothetical protein DMD87_19790 [Candidatus Rokubacteria bacterium]